jgi:hypothetical protein
MPPAYKVFFVRATEGYGGLMEKTVVSRQYTVIEQVMYINSSQEQRNE